MKFVCPACASNLYVPDNLIPPNGGWARCPKCKDRFFIKASPVFCDREDKNQSINSFPRKRSSAEQELINRMKSKTFGDQDDERFLHYLSDDAAVVIIPELVPSRRSYSSISYLLLGVFLFFSLSLFFSASTQPDLTSSEIVSLSAPTYDLTDVQSDLSAIKRDLAMRKNINEFINYSGRESRVYKYFLAENYQKGCQQIESLRLLSNRGQNGFFLTAVCLDNKQYAPELQIQWLPGRTKVIMDGNVRIIDEIQH